MKFVLRTAFLAVISTSNLFANGGGYSNGVRSIGAFQPIGVDQVQMVSEDVEIDLHIEYAEVRIEYVLHNPGEKVKVTAGFPSAVYAGSWRAQTHTPDPVRVVQEGIRDFAITADGRKLDHQVKVEGMELKPIMMSHVNVNAWHVVEIKFDSGQTRRIQVSYRQAYYGSYFSVSDNQSVSGLSLTYLFSAAGLWAGPIERGTVLVRPAGVSPAEVAFSHPKRFQRKGEAWVWSFRNLEPTLEDDLVIHTRTSYATHRGGGTGSVYWEIGGKSDQKRWEVRRGPDSVAATSFLTEEENGATHPPQNLLDHDRKTAWVEGAAGDGIGESVTFKLKKPAKISRIGLVNGYAQSPELYSANNRIAELDVSVNGGTPMAVTVPDEYLRTEYFFFDLPKSPAVTTVKLTIRKVYPGSHFQDTSLSDVVLVVPLAQAPKISPIR